jgi:hypothetical protein
MGVLLFHSVTETEQKSWYSIEPFTLLSTYKNLQKKFITLYSPYEPLLKSYREATNTQIFSISDNYLNKNSEVPEENVALLKNAIELWRKATQTTHAIAPILFHYSWHCFNSFFAYTFFRWGQKHSQSHGVYVSNMTDEIEKIKITIKKTDGIFQRTMDTWSCLGGNIAFSGVLPASEGNDFVFHSNQMPFFQETNCCELGQLLSFDPYYHERLYWKKFGKKELVINPSFNYWMGTPTQIMQSYLILFIASSIARYRPILWASILSGDTKEKAVFALSYRDALLRYAQFGLNSTSFLHLSSRLFDDLMQGKFQIKHLP